MDETWEDDGDEEERQVSGINVTPLVDVCLVLVLIFMVTSPFFLKPLMEVKLPEAVAAEAETQENITISLSPEQGYAVNEIPISREALAGELRRQAKTSGISFLLIRADERVSNGEVQDLMKIARKAGMRRIAFATTPKRFS